MGRGRGDHAVPPQGGHPGAGNLVPTPVGMVPAHVAMQMGMNPMAMQGMMPGSMAGMPGLEGMNPMMMNMQMDPMMQMQVCSCLLICCHGFWDVSTDSNESQ